MTDNVNHPAHYEANLTDAKQEIQTRIKELVADWPTRVIEPPLF